MLKQTLINTEITAVLVHPTSLLGVRSPIPHFGSVIPKHPLQWPVLHPLHTPALPFCVSLSSIYSPSSVWVKRLMYQVGIKMCSEQSKRQFRKSYFCGRCVPPNCWNAGIHAKHEHVGCPFHYVSMHNFLSVFCLCCKTASFSTGHCWPC